MNILKISKSKILLLSAIILTGTQVFAEYTDTPHREPTDHEVAVSKPGSYSEPGTTYVLVNDIKSINSAIFLGKDVTLDLNGYTITYADGEYEHVPNYDFEEGLKDWDFSKAPGAKLEDKKVQVFIGDNILRLNKGEEITSQYINLPHDNRSYFAMCGVTGSDMSVSVYVEDEAGEQVQCINNYGSSQIQGSPVEKKSPRLGGGFVYAHLKNIPSGKYRIRVKAETDCMIDHVDIRPAMDVGIGIIEKTRTYAHVDHLYDGWWGHSAFYDYTIDFRNGTPADSLPVVSGQGTITIKNGIIQSGVTGILNWGIQSTANNVKIILDNVKVLSSGINTNAVNVPYANITNCYFDIQSPFIINRHGSSNYAVDLGNVKGSEVSFSEFYGGQGCLSFSGDSVLIHDNFFANRQTVTNHYSIMTGADNAKIYRNVFKPEIGSGVEIYKKKHVEIFDNEFHIEAAGPSCEYGHTDYSTNAIRIADYNAKPGADDGCFGNKIYNNKFFITGKDYPEYKDFIPVATAVFYSASGGDNFIYDNEIEVIEKTPGAKNETVAFYIGGGSVGGVIENNTIASNVPLFWIASMYGAASDLKINQNTLLRNPEAGPDFAHIKMGYWTYLAQNIEFKSNEILEDSLIFQNTNRAHDYDVYWTLTIAVVDEEGNAAGNENVEIMNQQNDVVFSGKSSEEGIVQVELKEYSMNDMVTERQTPYKVLVGEQDQSVNLMKNTDLTIIAGKATGINEEITKQKGFFVSPNPVQKELTVEFPSIANRIIHIVDMNQKIQKETNINSQRVVLDMAGLSSGIYFVRVKGESGNTAQKIIKL